MIFFPRGTQMLHFPRFDLYYLCSRVCLTHRIPIRRSQDQRSRAPTLSLSQLATSFISSQAKPSFNWRRHISIFSHILHDYTRRSSLAPGLGCQLRPSPDNFLPSCIFFEEMCIHTIPFFFKEVIRPQVPLRSPCYDFSLVARLVFDNAN